MGSIDQLTAKESSVYSFQMSLEYSVFIQGE